MYCDEASIHPSNPLYPHSLHIAHCAVQMRKNNWSLDISNVFDQIDRTSKTSNSNETFYFIRYFSRERRCYESIHRVTEGTKLLNNARDEIDLIWDRIRLNNVAYRVEANLKIFMDFDLNLRRDLFYSKHLRLTKSYYLGEKFKYLANVGKLDSSDRTDTAFRLATSERIVLIVEQSRLCYTYRWNEVKAISVHGD